MGAPLAIPWSIAAGLVLLVISLMPITTPVRAQGGFQERGPLPSLRESTPAENQEAPKLRIKIEGVQDQLRDNVEAFLEINKLAGETVPSESRLRWLHAQAEENIRTALQPFGYYRPQIETSLEQTPGGWEADYRIEPGPPLRIGKLDVQVRGAAAEDPAFQKILANLPLAEDMVLEHPRYEELKQSLQNAATERGYFDARLETGEIRIDLKAYQANVVVHFDSGVRYRFGEVNFKQDILKPEFLQRYHDIEPGEPYRVRPLLNLQSDLISSEYFSAVEVNASPDRAVDHTIPIDVVLEPQKARKYTFGAGYGTDTGPRGKIGVEFRRLNRRGHRLKADFLASQVKFQAGGEYFIPGPDPRMDSYSLRTTLKDEFTDSRNSQTATIGLRKQNQDGKWLKIYGIDYQLEKFEFSGESTTSTLLIPSLNWTRVDAEDRLNVTEGSRLTLELRGAHEFLLSDVSFLQGVVRGKYIRPLGGNGRVLARADVGASLVSDFGDLPASVRFFTGGDTSVRGYELESIGPRNDEGDVIGGRHLVVGSLEYEHRIKDKWSVAAFVDAGDAFDTDVPDFKLGAGAGVRWQSPIGPVRVDLAHGFQEPGDVIRLHLIIGPDL